MKTYLVGGAVRDKLLGLPARERDWVVVGATEQDLIAQGFRKVEAPFPVFLHPETGEEYALARTERKTAPGYQGFQVYAGPDVTLEDDLRRRDLTVNAMAEDPTGALIDPFDGKQDLDQGVLRHVSPAFVEDPVRLLRIARFAARFGCRGFRVAHGTFKLLKQMVRDGEVAALKPERIWAEMEKALGEDQPQRFFETLHRCGALEILWPELGAALGEPRAHDSRETAQPLAALQRAARAGTDSTVRFAAILAAVYSEPSAIAGTCERLRAPKPYRETAQTVARHLDTYRSLPTATPGDILQLLESLRAFQHPQRLEDFIAAAAAAAPEPPEAPEQLRAACNAARAIDAGALRDQGLKGAELGNALMRQREDAIAETLPSQ